MVSKWNDEFRDLDPSEGYTAMLRYEPRIRGGFEAGFVGDPFVPLRSTRVVPTEEAESTAAVSIWIKASLLTSNKK